MPIAWRIGGAIMVLGALVLTLGVIAAFVVLSALDGDLASLRIFGVPTYVYGLSFLIVLVGAAVGSVRRRPAR